MESAYNGMKRRKADGEIKVTCTLRTSKFADMEQALVTLATKNELVIGAAGQTQASVRKVAKRFPKVKFSIVGPADSRLKTWRSTGHYAGTNWLCRRCRRCDAISKRRQA